MELSENLKLRPDSLSGETQQDRLSRAPDAGLPNTPGPADEAESQMRKALGLLGESQRHRPDAERPEQTVRLSDRFNGGLHRRRFVQDGDIPVTVLRRDQGYEVPAHRGVAAPPAPTSSRLQRTEAALAAETAAREKAERSLGETQSVVRDLQTKIGHAELAKNEAVEALHREREAIVELRAEGESWEERLQEAQEQARAAERNALAYQEQLSEERHARKAAEKALRGAEDAREAAEQLVRALSEETPAPRRLAEPTRRMRVVAEPEIVAVTARRGRPSEVAVAEPEPVKWWLNTKSTGKKR
jgi:DNA repair exonuclease SbcCD ATPase subunit